MRFRAVAQTALLVVACARSAAAQDELPTTLVDHDGPSRLYAGGQLNAIYQFHPSFPAKYSGDNSLRPEAEGITSYVVTANLGFSLTPLTEIFLDAEMAAGGGISTALGLAGVTNVDVVRNPTLGSDPYPARILVRQLIPLSARRVTVPRGHLSIATEVPADRLEIRAGKFSTTDQFDVNSVGSDSHFQFMNWTAVTNGAYDYAADTRGYTYGATAELSTPRVALRIGEMLMPTVANGIDLDGHLDRSRGDNLELELRHHMLGDRAGAVRFLGWANHARMGSYREAIQAFEARRETVPDVTAHRKEARVRYGVGLNVEQELPLDIRLFLRAGWSEGHYECFAYTEVNDALAIGGDLAGGAWHRPGDKVGLALMTNGLSDDHRRYLELGGKGFLLGDGHLSYGREMILESYYNLRIYRGVFAATDLQIVGNPGYNKDRGPVVVLGLRGHLEI